MSIEKLWLEFEEVDPENWDIKNAFCNVGVTLKDGRKYGLNVWTFGFLHNEIMKATETKQEYIQPPDLLVQELTRRCIENTIEKLLQIDTLEKMLNPSILSKG